MELNETTSRRLREVLARLGLNPGDRIPGERELASALGIGRTALRPALDSLENTGIIERRAQSGTFLLEPVTPLVARKRIAVMAPFTGAGTDIARETDPIWLHRVAAAFERTISSSGAQVVFQDQTPYSDDPCSIKRMARDAAAAGFQGAVLIHPLGTRGIITHALAQLHDAGIHPLIVSARTYPGLASQVYFDSSWGTYRATRYLIELGHERIGFAGVAPGHEWVREREKGWRDSLDAAEIDEAFRWSFFPGDLPGSERIPASGDGAGALDFWLETEPALRPTAIVAANDVVALGILARASERGVAVPGDLSVIGFDNDPAALLRGLTTVERPSDALGETAARAILERLAAGDGAATVAHRLRPVIIERTTTAAPNPGTGIGDFNQSQETKS